MSKKNGKNETINNALDFLSKVELLDYDEIAARLHQFPDIINNLANLADNYKAVICSMQASVENTSKMALEQNALAIDTISAVIKNDKSSEDERITAIKTFAQIAESNKDITKIVAESAGNHSRLFWEFEFGILLFLGGFFLSKKTSVPPVA